MLVPSRPSPDYAQGQSLIKSMKRRALASVVLIEATDGEDTLAGSGFVVEDSGVVATCLHVIDNVASATVRFSDGTTYPVRHILATDELRDLALVQIAASDRQSLSVARQKPEVGDRVVLFGNAWGRGFSGFEGTVSNADMLHPFSESIVASSGLTAQVPGSGGCSGSPLIDEKGEVVGVISQKDPFQPILFAVAADSLRKLLSYKRVDRPLGVHLPWKVAEENQRDRRAARDALTDDAPTRARPLLARVLARNPQDVHALSLTGYCYLSEERPDEALDCFKRALKVSPSDVSACFGYCLVRGGEQGSEEVILARLGPVAHLTEGTSIDDEVQFLLGWAKERTHEKTGIASRRLWSKTRHGRVPDGFSAKQGTRPEPYTYTGWAKEVIHEKTGIEMVFIPAGTFQMGSPSSEGGRFENEGPVHTVRITRPFYLSVCEVTHREWNRVTIYSGLKDDWNPVESASWNYCQRFLRKAGDGLRLPTEAEWEYACRAGAATAYSFGDESGDLQRYAWYDVNSGVQTHVVGEKLPNAWGLYDMHGNVWEWCADWYGEDYYSKSPREDPRGPCSGTYRVLRGGSWFDTPAGCRSAYRHWVQPASGKGVYFGFRVARGL